MLRAHILVLAKAPVPGRAKTRLTPPLSEEQAAAVAEAALADTLDAVAASGVERRIIALDGEPGPWLPPGFEIVPQVDGSFNDRLTAAWMHTGGPGLQIGMDTPQVTPELLEASLAAVVDGGHDAALGRAPDGGWWAIAMARPRVDVFDGVPMSTAETGRAQDERLRSFGWRVAALPELRDLDEVDDARAIAAAAPKTRTASLVESLAMSIAALRAPEVDVILPVLNEREAIPWVLERMPSGYRAIVVDNGSYDGSAAVAAEGGAVVVREPKRGFGSACFAGLTAATAPVVCFMDCDASLDPGDLPSVAGPVLDGEADLVLGAREAEDGALPFHSKVANRYLARQVRKQCGVAVSDIGPMRAARRKALLGLGLTDRRSGWPLEMVLRAGQAGWRVEEHPVPYRARIGRSKVTGTVRGTLQAIADMRGHLARAKRAAATDRNDDRDDGRTI
jgi:glycosyltransferase A (GT-A) superfamily protein (DUF2064 family)